MGGKSIGDIIREKNIILETANPALLGGFTQVPNFILEKSTLSMGARFTYSLFLRYAWHEDGCFPGLERLGENMGCSEATASRYVKELREAGYVTVERRGQGKTNIYKLKFNVQRDHKKKSVDK